MRLNGKVALVTGGGSGIGRAVAEAFGLGGAQVVICGRDRQKLDAAAREIGRNGAEAEADCLAISADLLQPIEISELVAATIKRFKALHILLNNAGVLLPGTAESLSDDQWEQTFATNVRAPWLVSRTALPHLRAAGGGSIINIASVLSTLGAPNRVAYAASKGALLAMTRAMALDHAAERIRVNCICPGIVETEMVAAFNMDEAARKRRLAMHPLGRFGQPQDVAGLAVFLASDESSWITGADYVVDGGYSAV
jgi:meso-butanediol dehydrogenase / (S,S)-butanediol dehydrogenase / diacetyl reductase